MSATSIATELTRIQTAKADIKTAIEAKGVQVPSNALIDTYDTYIGQISGGGGGQAEQDLKDLIERDITSITIPSGTTSIGNYAFNYCRSLTSVTIPNSVTSIGQYAFAGCNNLTNITIPNGVTSISDCTFQYCYGLTSVTIGNGVTSIGASAFIRCTALTSVTMQATTPPTLGNANAFQNTNANLVIYVPAESVETYKTTGNWVTYASRIQAIPSE